MKWRRRNIENYLLSPVAIARAAGVGEVDVRTFFEQTYGLAVPPNFAISDVLMPMRDARGKALFLEGNSAIECMFGVSRDSVAAAMTPDESLKILRRLWRQFGHFNRSSHRAAQ